MSLRRWQVGLLLLLAGQLGFSVLNAQGNPGDLVVASPVHRALVYCDLLWLGTDDGLKVFGNGQEPETLAEGKIGHLEILLGDLWAFAEGELRSYQCDPLRRLTSQAPISQKSIKVAELEHHSLALFGSGQPQEIDPRQVISFKGQDRADGRPVLSIWLESDEGPGLLCRDETDVRWFLPPAGMSWQAGLYKAGNAVLATASGNPGQTIYELPDSCDGSAAPREWELSGRQQLQSVVSTLGERYFMVQDRPLGTSAKTLMTMVLDEHQQLTPWTPQDDSGFQQIRSLYWDEPDPSLYVLTAQEILRQTKQGEWESLLNLEQELTDSQGKTGYPTAILGVTHRDPERRLWLRNTQYLFLADGGKLEVFPSPDDINKPESRVIDNVRGVLDAQGSIWLWGDFGAAIYQERDTVCRIPRRPAIPFTAYEMSLSRTVEIEKPYESAECAIATDRDALEKDIKSGQASQTADLSLGPHVVWVATKSNLGSWQVDGPRKVLVLMSSVDTLVERVVAILTSAVILILLLTSFISILSLILSPWFLPAMTILDSRIFRSTLSFGLITLLLSFGTVRRYVLSRHIRHMREDLKRGPRRLMTEDLLRGAMGIGGTLKVSVHKVEHELSRRAVLVTGKEADRQRLADSILSRSLQWGYAKREERAIAAHLKQLIIPRRLGRFVSQGRWGARPARLELDIPVEVRLPPYLEFEYIDTTLASLQAAILGSIANYGDINDKDFAFLSLNHGGFLFVLRGASAVYEGVIRQFVDRYGRENRILIDWEGERQPKDLKEVTTWVDLT